jgi:uncharacterized membrane protein
VSNKPQRRQGRDIAAVVQSQSFSGPLPHPDILAKYNDAVPNGAERIMAMAEAQSTHRMQLEQMAVRSNISSQTRGSVFAFILGIFAIGIGAWLILSGKDAQGLASIITALSSLTLIFIVGRSKQDKDRRDRQAQFQKQ